MLMRPDHRLQYGEAVVIHFVPYFSRFSKSKTQVYRGAFVGIAMKTLRAQALRFFGSKFFFAMPYFGGRGNCLDREIVSRAQSIM